MNTDNSWTMMNAAVYVVPIKLDTSRNVSFLLPSCKKHQNCPLFVPVFCCQICYVTNNWRRQHYQPTAYFCTICLLLYHRSFVYIACCMIDDVAVLQVSRASHLRSREVVQRLYTWLILTTHLAPHLDPICNEAARDTRTHTHRKPVLIKDCVHVCVVHFTDTKIHGAHFCHMHPLTESCKEEG